MRLAFTTDYYPPHVGGGVEAVVSEIATRLAGRGHQVMVVTLGRKDWPTSESRNGVEVHRFQSTRLDRLTGLELTVSLQALTRMKDVLRDFAPDVINAHHQYFTTTPIGLKAARDLGIPSVLTLHIAAPEAFEGWRGTAARLYNRVIGRSVLARADVLIAVSEAVAATAFRRPGQPIRVIPNGVDLARFRPAESRQRGGRIVFVGRMIANKGPHTALAAFGIARGRVPEATLTMVGDGPMSATLRRYAEEHGMGDSVTFLGLRDDVDEILRQSDVLVRPSQVEGMPLIILEAMATGLPVVACDVGGVRELVDDGVTGIVAAPGSVTEIAAAIIDLVTHTEMAAEMGSAALRTVRQGFNWDAIASENLQVFSELAGFEDA